MKLHNIVWLLSGLYFTGTNLAWTADYTITDIGTLSGNPGTSWPNAINNLGEVVGYSITASGANHAFIWSDTEGIRDLGDLTGGTDRSEATDINDSSQIVGYGNASTGLRATLWESGGIMDLGDLAGGLDSSEAFGINESGVVTGKSLTSNGSRPFLWDKINGMQDLGNLPGMDDASGFAISNSSEVVGSASGDSIITSFRWTPSNGMEDIGDLLTGQHVSFAFDVNDDSTIVGRGNVTQGDHGFFWRPSSSMTDLGVPAGAFYSSAYAINANNQIVGDETWPTGHRAAIWKNPTGPSQDLNDLIEPTSGWTLVAAYDINDIGQITGIGISPDFVLTGYVLSPKPTLTAFWPGEVTQSLSIFLFGSGFIPDQTEVSIDGVSSLGVQWLSPSLVLAIRPFGITSGDVTVTTPFGTVTASEQYGTIPTGVTVSGVWPAQVIVSDFVFVFGSGFVPTQTEVSINGIMAQVQVVNDGMLIFIVPAGATTGPIRITTPVVTLVSDVELVILP